MTQDLVEIVLNSEEEKNAKLFYNLIKRNYEFIRIV